MNLNQLNVFLKIVDAGNLTRAAKELSLPKSRVSRILSALEQDIGSPLLHRTTREMRLTEAGRELYEKSKSPLEELRLAVEGIQQNTETLEGLIRITAPMDLGLSILPQLLSGFQRQHPKVNIDVILSQQLVDLVRESVDIAIRIGPLQDSSLKALRLGSVNLVLAASPIFLQRNPVKKMEEISALPCLSFVGKNKTQWNLSDGISRLQLKLNPKVTSDNPDLLFQLALLHEGIALLPEFLCENAFRRGDLTPLFRSWKSDTAPVHLVHPYKKERPLRVKKFMEYLSVELPKLI